ncbi:MAG: hypothetical protein MJA28_02315 [Gammaproteobacteria bacterium]|nr:hypothetical protein [Gammaproteobacteria bacterium]
MFCLFATLRKTRKITKGREKYNTQGKIRGVLSSKFVLIIVLGCLSPISAANAESLGSKEGWRFGVNAAKRWIQSARVAHRYRGLVLISPNHNFI